MKDETWSNSRAPTAKIRSVNSPPGIVNREMMALERGAISKEASDPPIMEVVLHLGVALWEISHDTTETAQRLTPMYLTPRWCLSLKLKQQNESRRVMRSQAYAAHTPLGNHRSCFVVNGSDSGIGRSDTSWQSPSFFCFANIRCLKSTLILSPRINLLTLNFPELLIKVYYISNRVAAAVAAIFPFKCHHPTSPSGNGPDFAIWWHHLVRTFIITFLRFRGFLPKVNLHVYILLPERSEVSPKSCLGENINKNCNKMICRWFKFWPNFPKVGA